METISLSTPITRSSATADAAVVSTAAPMRAIVQTAYGSADVLHLGTAPRPTPGAGEVLVEVAAAGIDRGTWHLMTGRPYLMRIMAFGFRRPKNPVAGLDLAGTVVAVGPGVTRFAPGDEVFGIGRGSFAEYAVAREDKLARKPARLTFEQAAALGVSGGTALQALRDAGQLAPGERVLVIGASGGVGTFAVQLARAFGADVTAVCSTAKVDAVRALGATEVLDYSRTDFADGTRRFDLVLDVGGNTPLSRLRRTLTPRGRLVFVGNELGGDWTAGFGRPLAAMVLGLFVKQRFTMLAAKEHASHLEPLAELATTGVLTPHLDRVASLADIPAALRDLEAGRVTGKIAIRIR